VIDKSKYTKKERPWILKQVRQMMFTEHPMMSNFVHFFMSTDFFYFITDIEMLDRKHESHFFEKKLTPKIHISDKGLPLGFRKFSSLNRVNTSNLSE
jgi:hypothetical protein